jgi:nucleoside-diphosphate kinase
MERTLFIVKPEGLQRGLVGKVLSRFEDRGLKLVALKMLWMNEGLARRHYSVHEGKPFYRNLLKHITSSPVVVGVLEGTDAVEVVRRTVGATNPANAEPGTIRADFGIWTSRNLVHASDSLESARDEIQIFFTDDEILSWERDCDRWIMP